MAQGPAGRSPPGQEDAPEAAIRVAELETSRANRDVTVGLSGTCAAILTFALIFLYDRARSGEVDMTLFQLTLADLVAAEALLAYGGTCYAWLVAALRTGEPVGSLERWADVFLGLGMLALSLAPALILLTVNLALVGWFASAGWLVIPVAMVLRRLRRGHGRPVGAGLD